eukprot:SAG22_NODE_5066_length_1094_cov_1.692462_2_plen_249_part_01
MEAGGVAPPPPATGGFGEGGSGTVGAGPAEAASKFGGSLAIPSFVCAVFALRSDRPSAVATAMAALQRCTFHDAGFTPANFLLGLCLRRRGEYREAADAFLSTSCTDLAEQHDHLMMTGVLLAEHGSHWQAVDCFYRILQTRVSTTALANVALVWLQMPTPNMAAHEKACGLLLRSIANGACESAASPAEPTPSRFVIPLGGSASAACRGDSTGSGSDIESEFHHMFARAALLCGRYSESCSRYKHVIE